MTKHEQRQLAKITERLRRATIGMQLETWHTDVIEIDDEGKPLYEAVARDRFGKLVPKNVFDEAMKRIARRWRIVAMIKWVDAYNEEYLETAEIENEQPAKLNDMTQAYKEAKADLYAGVNPKFIRAYGWKAIALD